MGAAENAAIMRRAYEAFNTGDVNTLTELFDESAVWHLPGRSSMAKRDGKRLDVGNCIAAIAQ